MTCPEEVERRPGGTEITDVIEPKFGPFRVAPKKPREARPLAFARSPIARNQSSTEKRIRNQPLQHADPGPIVSPLQLFIRECQVHSAR